MADASIQDLLDAIETVRTLKEAIARHEEILLRLTDRLVGVEQRLEQVKAPAP